MGGEKQTEKGQKKSIGNIFLFFVTISVLSVLYIDQYWLGNILGVFSLFPIMILWILFLYYISENLPSKILKYAREKIFSDLTDFAKDILFYSLIESIVVVFAVLTFLAGGFWCIAVFGGPLIVGYNLILINEINNRWKNKKK